MVRIQFNELIIDEITKSSGVFSGKNRQTNWQAHVKVNQGFGTITGDKNKTSDHIHTVFNPDQFSKR